MTIRYLVRAQLDHGVLRTWTGTGTVEIDEPLALDGTAPGADAQPYTDGAFMVSVLNNAVTVGMNGRDLVNTPVGGRTVDLFLLAETDDGERRLLPTVRRGVLSTPTLEDGMYKVSIVPRVYVAASQQWSHEEQDRLHKGDTFFSQMRALAKGINGIHFPGVPNFREDGDYNRRAIAKPEGDTGRGSPDAGLPAPSSPTKPGLVSLGAGQAAQKLTIAPSGVPRGV